MKKVALIVLCIVLGFLVGYYRGDYHSGDVDVDTLRVVRYDTIRHDVPVVKDSLVVRYVTRAVKVFDAVGTAVECDTMTYAQQTHENILDSVSVEIPITQKVYEADDYKAYVSGYEAQLDSIFVRQKVITNTIHETKTIKENKFRRWNVGLMVGYGYGFKSQTFEPFIGVGVTISLF